MSDNQKRKEEFKKLQEELKREIFENKPIPKPTPKPKPKPKPVSKRCGKCKKNHPLNKFSPDKRYADNLKTICNFCEQKATKTYKDSKRSSNSQKISKPNENTSEIKKVNYQAKEQICKECNKTKSASKFQQLENDQLSQLCLTCLYNIKWGNTKRNQKDKPGKKISIELKTILITCLLVFAFIKIFSNSNNENRPKVDSENISTTLTATATTVPPTTTTTVPPNPTYKETETFDYWSGNASIYPYEITINSKLNFYMDCKETSLSFRCRDYEITTDYVESNNFSGNVLYVNKYWYSNHGYVFEFPISSKVNFLSFRYAPYWYNSIISAKVTIYFENGTSKEVSLKDIIYDSSSSKNYEDFRFKNNTPVIKISIKTSDRMYIDNLTWGYSDDNIAPTWPSKEMRFANITQRYFEVLWDTAEDNVKVAGYYFYVDDVLWNEYIRINDNNSIFLDVPYRNTTYKIEIVAYDEFGNLSSDNPVSYVKTK